MKTLNKEALPYDNVACGSDTDIYSRSSLTAQSYHRRYEYKRHNHLRRLIVFCMLVGIACAAVYVHNGYLPWQRPSETTPNELVSLYDRNPEARQFVLNYDQYHNNPPAINLSEFAHSQTVPLLMQWDERWGYTSYAGQYFALSGCGPTCLSMAYIYLTGDTSMSPLAMGTFATAHGWAVDGMGSAWALIYEGGRELGLSVTQIPLQEKRVKANLKVNNPIICIMGPGDFTKTGHFIVLAGLKDDKIIVCDPNSKERSNKTWTYDELQHQIQNLWVLCKA
ncbi:C39 family peptidase [Atopobium fossor]|uniref:C39 family peptidase n=1 Tax=Atopobium fossor TaxID=39487 RepID=UPI00068834F8|nr:C39 family peptidase [Atopobium fossor]